MALFEKHINNLSILFKRLFRKYKLLHTCRMLPWIDSGVEVQIYHCAPGFKSYNFNNNSYNKSALAVTNWNTCSRKNFFSFSQGSRKKEFSGRKLVGFSMEEMFNVVSDVNSYKDFLPFCKKSIIKLHQGDRMKADLVIGFPPVVEKYTSHIRYLKPTYIMAESRDAILFDHLVTNWKFSPGLSKNPRSCVIYFYVSFEFKSIFHSQLANMFFNELVKQMESAFYTEAIRRYGKPTIPTIKLNVLNNTHTSNSSSSPSSTS
ncbi:coenzyme Q-binding protein COQ10 homolog B, mitochondrial [Lycorma delicatula]|uniref:coenzyme Q-binding protein COQ10 homolog B, mitochondrial n=1 Tax=Lycorma delicatula TaxID=130591 RepID=UPI003F511236